MRPKLKEYLRTNLALKRKGQDLQLLKLNRITFFSPDSIYLNPRTSIKIKELFKISTTNRRKIKLLLSFPRTALLRKYLNQKPKVTKNSLRFLKELEFCSLLEKRIDILLYRLGFVATLFEARHLISHKNVKVNNLFSTSFSRRLNKGDIITFTSTSYSRIKKCLSKEITYRGIYFNTFNNVEVNLKALRIVTLNDRVNLPQQLQHYTLPLNWSIALRE